MRIVNLTRETEENILENMLKRSPTQYGTYEAAVSEIIAAVREKKDEAVFAYTEKFDGAKLDASTVEVTEQEIGEAYAQVDSGLVQVIRKARENILAYHEKQKEKQLVYLHGGGNAAGTESDSAEPGRRICGREAKRPIRPLC